MTAAATTEDLKSWIHQMMITCNTTNYHLDISGNTSKGDGYLGEITFVQVKTNSNGNNDANAKTYNLVVKSAKKSDELRKQTPVIKEVFHREILLYTKIFPLLEQFQMNKGSVNKPFRKWPQCYYSCVDDKKEALILDNLKFRGFEIHDRKTAMNLSHVHLMFTQYARWHALSLAFKEQQPKLFGDLTANMTNVLGEFVVQGKMLNGFVKGFSDATERLPVDLRKKYDKFDLDIEHSLTRLGDKSDLAAVLLHGDCWTNNMMFKYHQSSNKTKPIDMRFLDFQLSRVASPIIDLSYFLYACADRKVLQNFDFLLQTYYSNLVEYSAQLGTNVDEFLTLAQLRSDWKHFGKFGLVMAPFILKITLCEANEAPDFAEMAERGEEFETNFDFKTENDDILQERIKDVLEHFAETFL